MKIIKFVNGGKEKTGLIEDNHVIELSSSVIDAINSSSIDKFKKDSFYKIEDS